MAAYPALLYLIFRMVLNAISVTADIFIDPILTFYKAPIVLTFGRTKSLRI